MRLTAHTFYVSQKRLSLVSPCSVLFYEMVSHVWLQKETEEGLGKTWLLHSQVLEQEVRPAMQDHMEEHG